jgi:hypothetical protein
VFQCYIRIHVTILWSSNFNDYQYPFYSVSWMNRIKIVKTVIGIIECEFVFGYNLMINWQSLSSCSPNPFVNTWNCLSMHHHPISFAWFQVLELTATMLNFCLLWSKFNYRVTISYKNKTNKTVLFEKTLKIHL